jgi:cytochrome c
MWSHAEQRATNVIRICTVLFLCSYTVVWVAAANLAQDRSTRGKTVWDGVYNEAQARRGLNVYKKACVYCHQAELTGGGEAGAAPLVGTTFMSQWRGHSLTELFATIAQTMPKDGRPFGGSAPVELTLEEYLDVVAYILQKNHFPSGTGELPTDETLARIMIADKPQ